MTDAQLYALLKAAPGFGPSFTAQTQANAITTALAIWNLPGNRNARSLLAAAVNIARLPSMGVGVMLPYNMTVAALFALAYAHNGAGNVAPYTNGGAVTAQDKDVLDYLGAGGENDSATACRVRYA